MEDVPASGMLCSHDCNTWIIFQSIDYIFRKCSPWNYIERGVPMNQIYLLPEICGMGLSFTFDGFRVIYALIAAFAWLMTGIFSFEYFAHYKNRKRYVIAQVITFVATEAIFLSADLYTTFVFFEIMSLASFVWVAQEENKEALRAANTYLAVAVIGGLVLLMGIFLLYQETGTVVISELPDACIGKNLYPAAFCMFVGFGAKAGAFPMHIWLPKAHPVAPAPASALLSGILTKTGVMGLLIISCKMLIHDGLWGTFILIIGTITMFWGALLAVFSINFKRTLACSSVSQIGFILVGIGMIGLLREENTLAVRGTFLHMMNHSLFKLILFMAAGVIYMNLHKLDLNEIRGYGRKKPLLKFIYLIGALGIGGIPLWSGYISKTLLHESIVEYIHGMEHGTFVPLFLSEGCIKAIEWIFLISGGMTVAYMTKLFVAVFLEKNEDESVQERYDKQTNYMNKRSTAVLTLSAVIVPLFGMTASHSMDFLADLAQGFMGVHHAGHEVHYFIWQNLKGSVISVLIGVIIYLFVIRKFLMKETADGNISYVNLWPTWADLEDYFYRPMLLKILPGIMGFICGILDKLMGVITKIAIPTGGFICSILDKITDVISKCSIAIGSFVSGCLDVSTDAIIVFLRKTIYRDSAEAEHPHIRSFQHWFTLKYSAFKENTTLIGRSLSYGLILFCLGLCATLIYLLVTAVR